jgi:septum formation protein
VTFEVVPADIDETPLAGESPTDYVRRLSLDKALTVAAAGRRAVVLAADTTVDVAGAILEKPVDEDDVRRMLRLLSGRSHQVHTGVTVVGSEPATIVVTTMVTFVHVTDAEVEWYVATGDGLGKAGGYGIQGAAARFVERVDGSVTNVIGLPLSETLALLR